MVSQREREKNRRIFPSRFFFEFFSFSLSLSLGFKTLKMESFFFFLKGKKTLKELREKKSFGL